MPKVYLIVYTSVFTSETTFREGKHVHLRNGEPLGVGSTLRIRTDRPLDVADLAGSVGRAARRSDAHSSDLDRRPVET
jgi:hypothetical protein